MENNYRTSKQFDTICENVSNGNWKDAAQNCVEFGFYANDLIKGFDYLEKTYFNIITERDLIFLIELATEKRT